MSVFVCECVCVSVCVVCVFVCVCMHVDVHVPTSQCVITGQYMSKCHVSPGGQDTASNGSSLGWPRSH